MIKAQYTPGSRLGNQMMQYSSLFALSRHTTRQLSIPAIDGFPNTTMPAGTRVASDVRDIPYTLETRHFLDFAAIARRTERILVNHENAYLENIYNLSLIHISEPT